MWGLSMIEHLFLPKITFDELELIEPHKEWLSKWLQDIVNNIEDGVVSSSLCLQGAISEKLVYQKLRTDWLGIIHEWLTDKQGKPLAYSEDFGKLLCNYNQWKQTTVHSIHSQWWLHKLCGGEEREQGYVAFVEDLIQPEGWIYNPSVSQTNTRTRMKSELMMSLAMGLEMMCSLKDISGQKRLFESALCSMPLTGYLSAEYFRLVALNHLGSNELAPVALSEVISSCEAGYGYCDFSLDSKVDDYMGSSKKTSRDQALHSAISCLHADYIADSIDGFDRCTISNRLKNFGKYLLNNPFDIPAFIMRDIEVPFGTDISPLELVSASHLVRRYELESCY